MTSTERAAKVMAAAPRLERLGADQATLQRLIADAIRDAYNDGIERGAVHFEEGGKQAEKAGVNIPPALMRDSAAWLRGRKETP